MAAGMGVFTQVSDTSSYPLLLGALFVMGMGMGATMMPIMSAALATLTNHEVARGSTLMNIVQQAAGSVGTAVMAVVLTNQYLSKPAVMAARAAEADPSARGKVTPDVLAQVPGQLADSFARHVPGGAGAVATCVIPSLLLPRKAIVREGEGVPAPLPLG